MLSLLKPSPIKSSEFILIFDLSSGGLQSHILEKKPNTPTKIIDNGFLPSPYIGFYDNNDDKKIIQELFIRSIGRLLEKYNLDWTQIYCILPTHLLKNDLNILRHAPGVKTRFNKDLIFKVTNNQKNKHFNKYKNHKDDLKIVDDVILKVTLDGKDIDDLTNYCEGQELCLHHFLCSAESRLLDDIKTIIIRHLKKETPISFFSRPLSVFKTISSAPHYNLPSSMIIDVSGDTTDIITIKDNVIHQIGWMPVGKNTIIRNLAEKTNKSFHHLNSELRLIAEDLMTPKTFFKEALEDSLNEWSYQLIDITGVEQHKTPIGILADDSISDLLSSNIQNRLSGHHTFTVDKEWLGLPTTGNKKNLGPFITSLFIDKNM